MATETVGIPGERELPTDVHPEREGSPKPDVNANDALPPGELTRPRRLVGAAFFDARARRHRIQEARRRAGRSRS